MNKSDKQARDELAKSLNLKIASALVQAWRSRHYDAVFRVLGIGEIENSTLTFADAFQEMLTADEYKTFIKLWETKLCESI